MKQGTTDLTETEHAAAYCKYVDHLENILKIVVIYYNVSKLHFHKEECSL